MGVDYIETLPIDYIKENERSLEAQNAILGSILISPEITGDVLSQTKEDDYTGANRTVYKAIRELFAENAVVDPVTVLSKTGKDYNEKLLELMMCTPTAANYKAYLKVLKEQTLLRQAREIGSKLFSAFDAQEVRTLIDDASKLLTTARSNWKVYTMEDLLHQFFNKYAITPDYIDWGIEDLNKRIYAEAGDFVILGGRPSVGKTALAIEMAVSIAKTKRVGFFSFETGPNKFIDRVVSMEFRIDLGRIKRRELDIDEFTRISDGAEGFCTQSVRFIHASGMTPEDIKSVALAYKFDVIFVDYLQIVNSGLPRAFATEQVRAISLGLHNLAQGNNITVISLAQLKRAENKEAADKAPTISDLKESGQIEQDADVIMFLYRKNAGERNSPRLLKVAKNKEGQCGTTELNFEGKYQTFTAAGCSVDDYLDDDEISEFSIESESGEAGQMSLEEESIFARRKERPRSQRYMTNDEIFRGKKR